MSTVIRAKPAPVVERQREVYGVEWDGRTALKDHDKTKLAGQLKIEKTHIYTYLRGVCPVVVFKAIHQVLSLTPPPAASLKVIQRDVRQSWAPARDIWQLAAAFDAAHPDYMLTYHGKPLPSRGPVIAHIAPSARQQPQSTAYTAPVALPPAPAPAPATAPATAPRFDYDAIEVLALTIHHQREQIRDLSTRLVAIDREKQELLRDVERLENTIGDHATTIEEMEGMLNELLNAQQNAKAPSVSENVVTRITAMADAVEQREIRPEIKAAFRTLREEVAALPKSSGHRA